MSNDLSIYESEMAALEEATRRLNEDSRAIAIFLIDADGRSLAAAGDSGKYDATSLGALTSGKAQTADGLAKLIGEREFSLIDHGGLRDHIHISIVANRALLVVLFDDRVSLGLVRLLTRKASDEFEKIFDAFPGDLFAEMTDDRLDDLFSE